MAQRRMFSLKVIDTDEFMDMPTSTQNLYFHLALRADDDGFVSNPKKILKITGCNDDDMKVLIGKKFIIPFESGICVIKHWRIHNYIQKDRYEETQYVQEKEKLLLLNNGAYESKDNPCIQNEYKKDTQVSVRLELGKVNTTISKDIGANVNPSSYGNEDINTVTNFLKEKLGGSLDGTQKENRRFAYLLLNRIKKDYPDKNPVDLIKLLIDYALKDSFHSKNATSFKYLFYNTRKILQTEKENIINPKYIKI